jgi:transposase
MGKSHREISRLLKISRNSVRKWLRQAESESKSSKVLQNEELLELIRSLLSSCRGNLIRVHEIITQEHHHTLAYSTLTYLVRKYQLRELITKRFGEYYYLPGEEMQHDTSPHMVCINGKSVKTQCASLIFGFSRKLFIQYYPCFTRFEAKAFLQQALSFMQGSCQRCIIDNTSVILAAGAGAHAVVAPEMVFFSRFFGFEFVAHAVNHANRKGKVERPFYYAETNFLAGRTFSDWNDLNKQAVEWCQQVANQKYKRALGMSPDAVYTQEKQTLIPLPEVMPPIYNHFQRVADTQGYIHVDCNRYSIPESCVGHTLEIYQYLNEIEIYYQHRLLAKHQRIIGQRDQRALIKGHHVNLYHREVRQAASEAEQQLSGINPILDNYLRSLKSHVRGRGTLAFKQLLLLKRNYPSDAFIQAVTLADQYGMFDLKRLETMIIKDVSHDFFNL